MNTIQELKDTAKHYHNKYLCSINGCGWKEACSFRQQRDIYLRQLKDRGIEYTKTQIENEHLTEMFELYADSNKMRKFMRGEQI
ncbi:MAG: hypothetical protein ACFFG0_56720 [Candidatus Thorarchaeota archaeon]